VADGVVGHHPQLRAGPVQQLAVDPVGEHGHQPGLAGDPVQQLGPRHDPLALPDLEPAALGQVPADRLGHPAGDEHGGHARILTALQQGAEDGHPAQEAEGAAGLGVAGGDRAHLGAGQQGELGSCSR
jgi:hypothetical protein